jgi:serine protease DegQ
LIGVQSRELSPEEWQAFKLPENSKVVLISGVLKNGPAEKSGIKAGDVVRQINDKSITDLRDLLNTVAGLEPGTKASVNVSRNGQTYNFVVVIGTRRQLMSQNVNICQGELA